MHVLVFYHWKPFDFTTDARLIRERLSDISLMPLAQYVHASTGPQLLMQMLVKAGLGLPLGLLLARWTRTWGLSGPAAARVEWLAGLTLALGVLGGIEVGQIFLPDRVADITDVLVAWAARRSAWPWSCMDRWPTRLARRQATCIRTHAAASTNCSRIANAMKPDTSRLIGTLVLGGAAERFRHAGRPPASRKPRSSRRPRRHRLSPTTKPATPPTGTPTGSTSGATGRPGAPGPADTGVQPPADYIIGADDALKIVFWREESLSGDVLVRPDGKISLALLNDVQAAGLTPNQLRESLVQAASRYVTDPSVTVIVKQINSRKVFVTGQVNKPGPFTLNDNMTVLQMLALAGGLQEWADADHILVMRTEAGQTKSYKFNYKDVRKGKNLQQNIALKPGDTIVVP